MLFLAVALLLLPTHLQAQTRVHSVFFEGTEGELHVYRSYGKTDGPTLLLIGGIQGDEPGGFLSADHYADFSLARGALIVVPRANFRSILLKKRKINEDMNRKFADKQGNTYEDKIVAILKRLIAESDTLLNLHDGSGFYSPKWESDQRNPKRYGQSIIADCETYKHPETGKIIALGDMARAVIRRVNPFIENPAHHFRFNNHRTREKTSSHKEQRKSATYYALNTCGIPAFGVETSKSLNMEEKVRHHNLVINAFMERIGIVPETPGLNLSPPRLDYLVIAVNDTLPVVVKNGQTLHLRAGDRVRVSHIEANYERGLTADIKGLGGVNDLRKQIVIAKPSQIVVRKDYYPCGRVYLALTEAAHPLPSGIRVSEKTPPPPAISGYRITVNGRPRSIGAREPLRLIRGDTLQIVDVVMKSGDAADLEVNFKGFVGDRSNNTGEDRGYVIHTDRDLWQRYSIHKKGRIYQVIVSYEDKPIGKLIVELVDPA